MTVKDRRQFKELVVGGISRKTTKLTPLPTNVTSEASTTAFLSERALRTKFMQERKQKLEEKRRADVEALQRALKWRIADAHAERDKREAARLRKIKTEQEGFVAGVDDFLRNKADQQVLQCKELHHVWENEVYHRIEGQISKRLGDRGAEDINARLCDQMDKYVDACSNKTLFRDIIIESEYNPFESEKAGIKVDARPRGAKVWDGIKDPCNEQIEKVMEIHQNKTADDMPIKGKNPGKATLPLKEWATGVIEDTPHGFAFKFFEKSIAEMDLSYEEKQQRAKRNMSTLSMDHYGYPTGSDVVSMEYPKGKKCFPGWKPGGCNNHADEQGSGICIGEEQR